MNRIEANIVKIQALVAGSQRIAVTCHVSPDGDAVGSSLGLMHLLRRMGKDATVVTPDMPPRILHFLPGVKSIVTGSVKPERARKVLSEADLIFCLDFNALMRLDRLRPFVEGATAPKILIDHHIGPEDFADVTISVPERPATAMLLYEVIEALGWADRIDQRVAECLLTGIMTDTGGLKFNSNHPDMYRIIAKLIEAGADKDRLYKLVFDTNSETRLRICGFALADRMTLHPEHRLAVITLSREELNRFGYCKGDTESLVNVPLTMPEIVWSVFMRQDEEAFVKVSMRSKGHFPVNTVCEDLFGGGGHENAAGGEFYGPLGDAVVRLLDNVNDYDKYL